MGHHESHEVRLLEEILRVQEASFHELKKLVHLLTPHITGFTITQENIMVSISPGNSPVFTATPTPAGTAPGPGLIPTWTSSDTVNAPVTADATGLVGTVSIPATAVIGTAFNLTVSLTNADGTIATGSASFTIVTLPTPDVTGFTIAQTA